MEKHSASYSDLELVLPHYLPPLRLMRTFRCNFQPIPFFLQDLLVGCPCSSCPDNLSRIIDLLKNIQTYQPLDIASQGKLWFLIRRILKRDLLANDQVFSDGRAIRELLLSALPPQEIRHPISPVHLYFAGEKVEPVFAQLERPRLPLTRQTSN